MARARAERPDSFGRGLMSQLEVIHALVLRETRTRFGAHKLGYMWALLEPIMMILTWLVLFRIAHRRVPDGMDPFAFLATGVIPYYAFSNTMHRVADSIKGNKALLFYPHVRPLDLAMARVVLELVTYFTVFVVLLGANALYVEHLEISDPMKIIMGFGLASMFGASCGLVFCVLAQFSNTVDRVRGPLTRPFFWVSGIFFTAEALPDRIRHGMLYNPVLHATELVRDGWFPNYTSHHVDPTYVMQWVLGLALVGLSLERVVRRKIEVT